MFILAVFASSAIAISVGENNVGLLDDNQTYLSVIFLKKASLTTAFKLKSNNGFMISADKNY